MNKKFYISGEPFVFGRGGAICHIEQHGGQVVEQLNGDTDYFVYGDIHNNEPELLLKAQEMGVKVINGDILDYMFDANMEDGARTPSAFESGLI